MLLGLGLMVALAATSGNARVSFVKQGLIKADVTKEYAASLFVDKRLKIYSEKLVPRVKPEPRKFSANILETSSINRGKDFLKEHLETFEKVETDYGIPKEDLVALMRVESNLGEFLGDLVVLNVFYTRLLTSPESKWQWDAANLIALGDYCFKAKIDCYSIKGSNAGAFGLSQFLPYSVQEWGVDGNGDGIINLFDAKDVIPSTANFLKQHGWDEDRTEALARYYGSGKTYPATVLGYADAVRDSIQQEERQKRASTALAGKAPSFVVVFLNKLYCVFSSLPYCEDAGSDYESNEVVADVHRIQGL